MENAKKRKAQQDTMNELLKLEEEANEIINECKKKRAEVYGETVEAQGMIGTCVLPPLLNSHTKFCSSREPEEGC